MVTKLKFIPSRNIVYHIVKVFFFITSFFNKETKTWSSIVTFSASILFQENNQYICVFISSHSTGWTFWLNTIILINQSLCWICKMCLVILQQKVSYQHSIICNNIIKLYIYILLLLIDLPHYYVLISQRKNYFPILNATCTLYKKMISIFFPT